MDFIPISLISLDIGPLITKCIESGKKFLIERDINELEILCYYFFIVLQSKKKFEPSEIKPLFLLILDIYLLNILPSKMESNIFVMIEGILKFFFFFLI
jgi:hypothetical protein